MSADDICDYLLTLSGTVLREATAFKGLSNELGTVKDWTNSLVSQSLTILKDSSGSAYVVSLLLVWLLLIESQRYPTCK